MISTQAGTAGTSKGRDRNDGGDSRSSPSTAQTQLTANLYVVAGARPWTSVDGQGGGGRLRCRRSATPRSTASFAQKSRRGGRRPAPGARAACVDACCAGVLGQTARQTSGLSHCDRRTKTKTNRTQETDPDGELDGRVSTCAAAGDGAPAHDVPLDGPDARRGRRRPPADLHHPLARVSFHIFGQLRLPPQRRPG